MNEDGSEHLYYADIDQPVVNFGVSVLAAVAGRADRPVRARLEGRERRPGLRGHPDRRERADLRRELDIGAAGVQFPRLQRFYVSVDSRADPFTDQPLKGQYLLNAWVNDVTPPFVRLLTTRVSAGRPLIVAQALDRGSGVDPLSLVLSYSKALVGASAYDPRAGSSSSAFRPPRPKLKAGRPVRSSPPPTIRSRRTSTRSATTLIPNTTFLRTKITRRQCPTVTWIEPPARVVRLAQDRAARRRRLDAEVKDVFRDDGARDRSREGRAGAASTRHLEDGALKKGVHT